MSEDESGCCFTLVLFSSQEALKLQQDMRKKKQEMLKTQIECQKVTLPLTTIFLLFTVYVFLTGCVWIFQALINRLEKNRGMKPEERANVMKTLKELTEKIAQLQNEMNPSPASQVSAPKPNHSQPKTKTDVSPRGSEPLGSVGVNGLRRLSVQAQKELLDAELDFHKKMSSGEDTTDLKRKLGQLQVEVKT